VPAKVLPDKLVEMLLRQGMQPKEIAKYLAEQHHPPIHVTPAAISVWRNRRGLPRLRADHSDLIPWPILVQHRNLYPAQMLRALSNRRQGIAIPELTSDRLDTWLQRLEEDDMVVHYEPDLKEGWFYVPRRPKKDTDVIRDPRV